MIKNYLKVAIRSISKNKVFSFINIVGLAIGMAACLLILQYVRFELSYDTFNTNGDRLYRINQDRYTGGKLSTQWAAGASAVGPAFKAAFPDQIEDYVKLLPTGESLISYGDTKLVVKSNFLAGSSFFKMFSYPLLQGDVQTALKEPSSAVLSQEMARKLFHGAEAMGQTITVFNKPLKVTGIMRDMPDNSHLKFEILESYATLNVIDPIPPTYDREAQWYSDGFTTYVLLKPGVKVKELEAKFVPIAKNGLAKIPNERAVYTLQPVKDIHLYSNRMMEAGNNGDGKSVYLLLGIALFVIVIAWINYINLATARGMARAKEVGIRKTLGSEKRQLIVQFMLEAMVFNGLALILSVTIIVLCMPVFTSLTGLHIGLSLFSGYGFWAGVSGLFLIGSFLSGFYPAIVLSAYKPVAVLNGKLATTSHGAILRKSMVIFQFAASIFLLIGALTVYRQVNFMQQQRLGVTVAQTVVIRSPMIQIDSMKRDMGAFKQACLSEPAIKSITISSDVPGAAIGNNRGNLRMVGQSENANVQSRVITTDYDFLKNYGIKMIAGRGFSSQFAGDNGALVLTRSTIQLFGFDRPEEIVGKQMMFGGDPHTVIGVAEDFHQQSLRDKYDNIIFRCDPNVQGNVSVKVNARNVAETIALLKTNWSKFFPGDPFDYYFLDKHYNEQYNADQRFGKVFGIFTLIAIFVACLGLFGLVSYTIVQRTKEIGIRKVLGASVESILKLLYKDFALLVVIAFVLSAPVAYFAIDKWLHGYAFRVGISLATFLFPFVAVVMVAFSTVSWLSIKAALMNPVKSLKTE